MMEKLHVFGVHKIFDTESLLSLFYALCGECCILCLFVNDVVAFDILVRLFIIEFNDFNGL